MPGDRCQTWTPELTFPSGRTCTEELRHWPRCFLFQPAGTKHKTMLEARTGVGSIKSFPRPGVKSKLATSTKSSTGLQNKTFYCETCDVHVNSETQLKQVREALKHSQIKINFFLKPFFPTFLQTKESSNNTFINDFKQRSHRVERTDIEFTGSDYNVIASHWILVGFRDQFCCSSDSNKSKIRTTKMKRLTTILIIWHFYSSVRLWRNIAAELDERVKVQTVF